MRFEGVVSRWNDDRGFGFLKAFGNDDAEVFVHISEFPKDGQRPTVGERVSFELMTDEKGKNKAKNLFCLDRPKARSDKADKRLHTRRRHSKCQRLDILAWKHILGCATGDWRCCGLPVCKERVERKAALARTEPDVEQYTRSPCAGHFVRLSV